MQAVWDALNDPDVLGTCITGCQEVTRVDEHNFNVRVKAKVGPVSATFQAALELKDLDPPRSYVIEGGVKGGAAGFGKGTASVQLEESGTEAAPRTLLNYTVNASVGGKLAQIGSRLVDGAARKMADEFFSAFSKRVGVAEQPAAEEAVDDSTESASSGAAAIDSSTATAAAENSSETESSKADAKYEASGNGMIWMVVFAGLALAVILAF